MDVKEELAEGMKKIADIQKVLVDKDPAPREQLAFLEKKVDGFSSRFKKSDQGARVTLLAHLCLLSEVAANMDFNRMISAREKFQDLLPEHFAYYLAHLKESPWAITWSGCLDCRRFVGRCQLNLSPQDDPDDEYRLKKMCDSYSKRSSKL
ncbi:MAG: hypothetical protein ACE5E0_03565 [Terriglobia bacterium]